MIKPTSKLLFRVLLCQVALLFLVGCSLDSDNPVVQTTADPVESTDLQTDIAYPQWTDAEIENLIPGFRVLKVDERAYSQENALDDQRSVLVRRLSGGTVSHRNNGVQIGPWQLWEDRMVTVSTPNPGQAIVDFYPHPYHFNGCIRIWIDLTYIQLPPGMRWDQLAFFYVTDSGEFVRYWGQIDLGNMTFSAWPDHFSRYIISAPVLR